MKQELDDSRGSQSWPAQPGLKFLKHEDPEAGEPWRNPAVTATAGVCLALVLLWILRRIWPALFIPWWFNTDEVVFYYEMIRQLRLDPSQTFFDIPGTPFVTLTSILTALWWAGERLAGMTAAGNPSDFAFANVQGVFTLMRALTLSMYAGAVALIFDLFRRSAGALAAMVAALLFATLPIEVHYSHFSRTESLGLVLSFSAIWLVLYSRRRGGWRIYGVAGILAGIGMGARFHFALVGLPVIMAILLLRDGGKLAHGPATFECGEPDGSGLRVLHGIAGALAAVLIGGAAVTAAFKAHLLQASGLTNTLLLTTAAGPAQYPGAKAFVAKLWLLFGLMALAIFLAYSDRRARRWIWPVVNPFSLALAAGFAAGFLLSNPEFLWRGEFQLRSIQFYSDWTDPKLASAGALSNWWSVSAYYFHTALPERWLQASFLVGIAIILWQRKTTHVAFLGGAAICFFAHPLTMKLWPHHVIPWLPFLCFVAAVPAGWAGARLTRRYRYTAIPIAIVIFSTLTVVVLCRPRLLRADEYLLTSRARTGQIAEMDGWLSKNVPGDAYLLVSYFALNSDGFLEWIESSGVRVPEFAKKHRNVQIWWLDRAQLEGRAGYVCISRADIAFFREDFERKKPNSTYNPFEDSGFHRIAGFGGGFYELGVFQFDFRSKPTSLRTSPRSQRWRLTGFSQQGPGYPLNSGLRRLHRSRNVETSTDAIGPVGNQSYISTEFDARGSAHVQVVWRHNGGNYARLAPPKALTLLSG